MEARLSRPLSAIRVLADRRHLWAFVAGCVAVTAGVVMHLPMFWMGRDIGFRLADMPMDDGMLWGMALIVAGIGVAGYGLLPRKPGAAHARRRSERRRQRARGRRRSAPRTGA